MSASNLMTSIKRTSLNVYQADIFKCSRQLNWLEFDQSPFRQVVLLMVVLGHGGLRISRCSS
jgi:hypothetical protein